MLNLVLWPIFRELEMFVQKARVLQISLFAILSAFVVELVFGLLSNSLGLITDSIHALLDSIVTVVLLLAAKMAMKPPDREHTYGHGKIESLGGLFGGIAILLIAGFFIYESLARLQSPEPAMVLGTFGMIGGIYAIGIDTFRIALLRRSIKKVGGAALRADFYHAFMDLGSTLLAIAGIALASVGFFQGDFIAALVLGGLLVALSIKLIYRTAMDLTDVISPDLVGRAESVVRDTPGVMDVRSVLMRRSGDVVFAEATVLLRADVSFERAHEISTAVEDNLKKEIAEAAVTVHFEPNWKDVPKESKIRDVAVGVSGVKDVHNVSLYTSESKIFANLHVMVEGSVDLFAAHKIADLVEQGIQGELPEVDHVTVHLEPYVTVPEAFHTDSQDAEERITGMVKEYEEIRDVTRITVLNFESVLKIEIDCSFDGTLSVEKVHDVTSEIERRIRSQFKNALITIHPEPV